LPTKRSGVPIFIGIAYFLISPNPATNEITIHAAASGSIELVEIYDVLGIRRQLLVVSSQSSLAQQLSTDNYPLTVDVSKLSPGIYFVRVSVPSGKVKGEKEERVGKFVKQ